MRLDTRGFLAHRPVIEADFSIEIQRSPPCRMVLPRRRWHTLSFYRRDAGEIVRSGAWGVERAAFPAASIGVYPAGSSEISIWTGAVEALHLHISPALLSASLGRAPGRAAGLVRRLKVEDADLAALLGTMFERAWQDADPEPIRSLLPPVAKRLEALGLVSRADAAPAVGAVDLETLLGRMHGHAAMTATTAGLARLARLGKSQFHDRFMSAFGTTPHNYLLRNRIELAKSRLPGAASMAGLAIECGFYDQAHFTRAFRGWTGMTPRDFARWFSL